jgi:GH15 family glucan-1,4-alpha-glucosidase
MRYIVQEMGDQWAGTWQVIDQEYASTLLETKDKDAAETLCNWVNSHENFRLALGRQVEATQLLRENIQAIALAFDKAENGLIQTPQWVRQAQLRDAVSHARRL